MVVDLEFYTYLIRDPIDGKPIYVGKGKDDRAWQHIGRHRGRLGNLLRKRVKEGYVINPIINYEADEQTALEMERFWIAFFGRADLGAGTLFNLTDGGEGTSGHKWIATEEWRSAVSASLTGKPRSEETKEKIRQANLGKKYSPELRQKLSDAHKGRKQSADTIAKKAESLRAAWARKREAA